MKQVAVAEVAPVEPVAEHWSFGFKAISRLE